MYKWHREGTLLKTTSRTLTDLLLFSQNYLSALLHRTDTRVLTFDEAVSACKHGKGKANLARPVNMLEAFSYLGYARERGLTSFWSDKLPEGEIMQWSSPDGTNLNVSAGERRCVLVSTTSTDIHGAMFAELRPCHARLADGVICESAMAFRKYTRSNAITPHSAPTPHPLHFIFTIPILVFARSSPTAWGHGSVPTPTPTPSSVGRGCSNANVCEKCGDSQDGVDLFGWVYQCRHCKIVL